MSRKFDFVLNGVNVLGISLEDESSFIAPSGIKSPYRIAEEVSVLCEGGIRLRSTYINKFLTYISASLF